MFKYKIKEWVWPRKTAVKKDSTDKSLKKQTKPDTKIQLEKE